MSNESKEKLEAIQGEAQDLLEQIKQIKVKADEQLQGAATAKQKADSEALFAFNAKGACEGHSTAIANLKGTVEADVNSIVSNKQKADELLAAITLGKAATDADASTISDCRKKVEQASGEILAAAEKVSVHHQTVNECKNSVEALVKETEGLRDAAIQARNKTDTARSEVEQFSTEAVALAAEITKAHETSTRLSAEINGILTSATADKESLKQILDHLTKSDETARGHEARVATLTGDAEALKNRVEGLLPGATSAGLASAFKDQKLRFSEPQKRWLKTFIWCMVGLFIVSLPSFISAIFGKNIFGGMADSTWDAVLRGLTMRLPILVPLVWLAIYAGRNYMLSLRLEEDYAYKEAISTAFEGYKREMEKFVAGDATNPTPITTLCINVLRAIAERPGRIYEGKQQDLNLLSELNVAVEKADELRKKKIAAS